MIQINGERMCRLAPPGARPFPEEHIPVVKRATEIISTRIVSKYKCDDIFKALPKGRTFRDMFHDPNIWLHYDDSTSAWGWVMPGKLPRDVVIGRLAVAYGRWSIAGTIVHELAHLNGADGRSHAAEETLKHCGLQSPRGPYDPHIKG